MSAFQTVRRRVLRATCTFRVQPGNAVVDDGSTLRNVILDVRGAGNEVRIGRGARLRGVHIVVEGEGNRLSFGCDTAMKLGGLITIRGERCELSVGRGTTIESARLSVGERDHSLRIGEDCMLAYDVEVRTTDGHSLLDATSGQRINAAQSVEIGDHVWVAAHALILKGVHLGSGSIVAGGAVVARSVANNCVVGGNPARVLRENVTWDRRLIGP